MKIRDYLIFATQRLLDAEEEDNKEEWARIARIVIDVLKEKIREIEEAE